MKALIYITLFLLSFNSFSGEGGSVGGGPKLEFMKTFKPVQISDELGEGGIGGGGSLYSIDSSDLIDLQLATGEIVNQEEILNAPDDLLSDFGIIKEDQKIIVKKSQVLDVNLASEGIIEL